MKDQHENITKRLEGTGRAPEGLTGEGNTVIGKFFCAQGLPGSRLAVEEWIKRTVSVEAKPHIL